MTVETFTSELCTLINKHSMENGSNTPDFVLAEYLTHCLLAFNDSMAARDAYWGKWETDTDKMNKLGEAALVKDRRDAAA